jgi:hypothetical protein
MSTEALACTQVVVIAVGKTLFQSLLSGSYGISRSFLRRASATVSRTVDRAQLVTT